MHAQCHSFWIQGSVSGSFTTDDNSGMCRGWEKRQIRRRFAQSNLNSARILSLLFFSLTKPVYSLRPFQLLCFFPSCTDATNHRSRQTRDYAMVPRASKVEASEFFVKSNANTIRGAGNFKQLLESSHVLLQRRKEVRSRMGERESFL